MTTFAAAIKNTLTPSLTANGMLTNESSLDNSVDLYFSIGSARNKDMTGAFSRAYAVEPDIAMKILFWARDIREGAGERQTFRNIIKWLEANQPDSLMKNLSQIPVFGRWDDLLEFVTPKFKLAAYNLIARALCDSNGLCSKWMPRKGPIANELRKYMNLDPKSYRKLLVNLTKVVETQMCANEWSEINYSHVPSVASSRYQKVFNKRDKTRYDEWKAGLKTGETKVNASAIYPYDVIKSVSYGDQSVAVAQWDALPNFLSSDDRILPMVDVSGSMSSQVNGQHGVGLSCMDVAVSLGLYIADKQTGAFKDCFLTFSEKSRIQVLQGNLLQKMQQLKGSEWGMNTNLDSAFREIIRVAQTNNVPATEMPSVVLIISDMEFDRACSQGRDVTAFSLATSLFKNAGYEIPKIVWWNISARSDATGNVPVKFNQTGTALISGFSPSIMKSVLAAKSFTPRDIMLETVNTDRYKDIVA